MIVVYTCIAGSYDTLIKQPQFKDVRYVCFSDSIPAGIYNFWEVIPIDKSIIDTNQPNLLNRFHKILPDKFFSKYEYSLYIDGNIKLKINPADLLDRFKKSNKSMAVFRHPNREYLQEELEECINNNKLKGDQINQSIFFLESIKREGFSSEHELVAGYILLRKHNDIQLNNAMKDWYYIVRKKIPRDQLSLTYALWKNNIDLAFFDDWVEPKNFFDRFHHGYFIPIIPLKLQNFFKKIIFKLKIIFHLT